MGWFSKTIPIARRFKSSNLFSQTVDFPPQIFDRFRLTNIPPGPIMQIINTIRWLSMKTTSAAWLYAVTLRPLLAWVFRDTKRVPKRRGEGETPHTATFRILQGTQVNARRFLLLFVWIEECFRLDSIVSSIAFLKDDEGVSIPFGAQFVQIPCNLISRTHIYFDFFPHGANFSFVLSWGACGLS
jgi:hypothetical protein